MQEKIFMLQLMLLKKKPTKFLKKVLNEILPEAFAVVKETARRFKENTEITVTATAKDRELICNKIVHLN